MPKVYFIDGKAKIVKDEHLQALKELHPDAEQGFYFDNGEGKKLALRQNNLAAFHERFPNAKQISFDEPKPIDSSLGTDEIVKTAVDNGYMPDSNAEPQQPANNGYTNDIIKNDDEYSKILLKSNRTPQEEEALDDYLMFNKVAKVRPDLTESVAKAKAQSLKKSAYGFAEGVSRLPGQIYDIAATPQNIVAHYTGLNVGAKSDNVIGLKQLNDVSRLAREESKRIASKISVYNPDYDKGIVGNIQEGNYLGALNTLFDNAIESSVTTMASMGVGYVASAANMGKVAADVLTASVMGGTTSGMQANKLQEENPDMPVFAQTLNSSAYGVVEYYGEKMFGAGATTKALKNIIEEQGVSKARQIVNDIASSSWIKAIQKNPAMEFIGEGGSEYLTAMGQNTITKLSGENPDINITDGALDAALAVTPIAGVSAATLKGAKMYQESNLRRTTSKQIDQVFSPLRHKTDGQLHFITDSQGEQWAGIDKDATGMTIAKNMNTGETKFMSQGDIANENTIDYETFKQERIKALLTPSQTIQENAPQPEQILSNPQINDIIPIEGKNYIVENITGENIDLMPIDDKGEIDIDREPLALNQTQLNEIIRANQGQPTGTGNTTTGSDQTSPDNLQGTEVQNPGINTTTQLPGQQEPSINNTWTIGKKTFNIENQEDGSVLIPFTEGKDETKTIEKEVDDTQFSVVPITEEIPIPNVPQFAKKKTETVVKGVKIVPKQNIQPEAELAPKPETVEGEASATVENIQPEQQPLGVEQDINTQTATDEVAAPVVENNNQTNQETNGQDIQGIPEGETVAEKKPKEINPTDLNNQLIGLVEEYNSIPKNHTKKRNAVFQKVNSIASQLGVHIGNDKNSLTLNTADGKKLRRIGIKQTKEEIELHKGLNDYDESTKQFIQNNIDNPNVLVLGNGIDWNGQSRKEREAAIRHIAEGKKTVAANRLLDNLEKIHNDGGVEVFHNVAPGRNEGQAFMPIEDINSLFDTPEQKQIDEIANLSDEEYVNLFIQNTQITPEVFAELFSEINIPGNDSRTETQTSGRTEPENRDNVEGSIPDNQQDQPTVRTEEEQPEVNQLIDQKANEAATSPNNDLPQPTEPQKEAGNYQKGHIKLHGLDISIENPKDSKRTGTDEDGKVWETTMQNHYGYIRETKGKDKDHVDTFIGNNPESEKVFVVDQVNPKTGKFDEHKVMLGFNSQEEAQQAYLNNYEPGWQGLGAITEMPIDQFKDWVKDESKTKKALSYSPKLVDNYTNENSIGPLTNLQQSELDKSLKEIDSQIEETNKRISSTKKARERKFTELNSRNGLFGDTKQQESSLFGNETFAPTPENISKALEPFDAEIRVANENLDRLNKLRQGVIDNAGKQGEINVPEKQEPKNEELKPEKREEVTETPNKIEDFGEKIEGAKKDLYKKLEKQLEVTNEEILAQPLSRTMPVVDYISLVNNGIATKAEAALLFVTRDQIGVKPQMKYKLQRWLEQVKTYQTLLKSILDKKAGDPPVVYINNHIFSISEKGKKVKLLSDLGFPETGQNIGDFDIKIFDGISAWRYNNNQKIERKVFSIVNRSRIIHDFDTYEEAVAGLKYILNTEKEKVNTVKFDIWTERGKDGYVVGKKVGSGKYIPLKDGFVKLSEARVYIKEHQEELEKLLDDKKVIPSTRPLTQSPRIGKNYLGNNNVTPELFQQTFGFRGVQFGNYVEQDKRQKDLNDAYDAFMDLAEILHVPPSAVSLGGKLGIAFGARGKGGVDAPMAHYESGEVVINFTKRAGAGTLAHEWFHALDNYFSRQRNNNTGYVTEKPYQRHNNNGSLDESIRPEVLQAFKDVISSIEKSELPKRSKELDKRRSNDYWSTIIEMAARSFESYVDINLKNKEAKNDYLVSFNDMVNYIVQSGGDKESYPYPTEQELETIGKAFKNLFNTIKTKQNEEGKTILFSGSTPKVNYETNSELTNFVKESQEKYYANEIQNTGTDTTGEPQSPGLRTETNLQNSFKGLKGQVFEEVKKLVDRYKVKQLDEGYFNYIYEKYKTLGEQKSILGITGNNITAWADSIYLALPDNNDIRFSASNQPFYQNAERALQSLPEKGTVQQFKQGLLKNGAKPSELEWMGWDDTFTDSNAKVTKQDIQDWIDGNRIEVKEVVKESKERRQLELQNVEPFIYNVIDSNTKEVVLSNVSQQRGIDFIDNMWNGEGETKYSQYKIPGGTNYKEVLFTLPVEGKVITIAEREEMEALGRKQNNEILSDKELKRFNELRKKAADNFDNKNQFKSSHFDEPNIVAHLRMQDFTDKEGKKVLMIEEIQSDWAQKGKKEGFKYSESRYEIREVGDRFMIWNKQTESFERSGLDIEMKFPERIFAEQQVRVLSKNNEGVPSMPFPKTDQWTKLSLRYALKYAAENGYDKVAWTTGEQQAERYDLSKQVDKISVFKGPSGYAITLYKNGEKQDLTVVKDEKELESIVGKDLATKIVNDNPNINDNKSYEGIDLKVGGEGMKGFYDNIIPKVVKDLTKQNIGTTNIKTKSDWTPNAIDTNSSTGIADKETWEKNQYINVHSIDITPELKSKFSEAQPLFQSGKNEPGLPIDQAQKIFDDLNSKVENPSKMIVVASEQDIVPKMRELNMNENSIQFVENHLEGNTINGFYEPNTQTTFIVGSPKSGHEAIGRWLHEVGQHHGLRLLFPEQAVFDKVMKSVFESVGGREGVKKLMDEIDILYGNKVGDTYRFYENEDDLTLGEEYLAFLSQKIQDNISLSPKEKSVWQKLFDAFMEFITKVLNLDPKEVKFTDKDLADIVQQSVDKVVGYEKNNISRVNTETGAQTDLSGNNLQADTEGTSGTVLGNDGAQVNNAILSDDVTAKLKSFGEPANILQTGFILPDGFKVAKDFTKTHDDIGELAGTTKQELLNSGVIRIAPKGAELHKKPNPEQFKQLRSHIGAVQDANSPYDIDMVNNEQTAHFHLNRYAEPYEAISAINDFYDKGIVPKVPSFSGSKDITKTEAFKKWFGNSKVVDENGKPLVVYHGTDSDFNTFHTEGINNLAFFTDNPEVAKDYGKNVFPVYLKIENITEFDFQGKWWKDEYPIAAKLQGEVDYGQYDGLLFKNTKDPKVNDSNKEFPISNIYAVKNPSFIKSATGNNGNFDPNNPNILFSGKTKEVKEPEEITAKEQANLKSRENVQDSMINVRRMQEGLKVRDQSDIYHADNRKNSRAEYQKNEYDEKHWKPIIKAIDTFITKYGRNVHDKDFLRIQKEKDTTIKNINSVLKRGHITQAKAKRLISATENTYNKLYEQYLKNDIGYYMMAKHAPEYNLYIWRKKRIQSIKKNKELTNEERSRLIEEARTATPSKDVILNYSGFTDEDANNIVTNFEAGMDKKDIDDFWSRINSANDFVTQKWIDYGKFKDRNAIDQIGFKYYVPLRGWQEEYQELKSDYVSNGEGGEFAGTPEANGRKNIADNPLSNMLNMAQSVISWGERNIVNQRAVYLAMANNDRKDVLHLYKTQYLVTPDDLQIEVAVIDGNVYELLGGYDGLGNPKKKDWGKLSDLLKKGNRISTEIDRSYELHVPKYKANQHLVNAYIKGQKMTVVFNDENIANEINKAYVVGAIPNIKIPYTNLNIDIAGVTRFMSITRTGLNAAFMLKNPLRDIEGGIANTFTEQGAEAAGKLTWQYLKNPLLYAGKDKKIRAYYEEFKKYGGRTGTASLNSIEEFKKNIDKEIRAINHPLAMGIYSSPKKLLNGIERLVYIAEMSTRFAAYVAARQNGESVYKSIDRAKEISVNFDRKGNYSAPIGSFVQFYNATIQATQKHLSYIKNPKTRYRYLLAAGLTHAALGYLSSYLWNMFTDGDDDKEEKISGDPTEGQEKKFLTKRPGKYDRYNNFVLSIGDAKVSIPLAQNYRAFNAIGCIAYDLQHGLTDEKTAMLDLVTNIQNAVSPVEFTSIIDADRQDVTGKSLILGLFGNISFVEPTMQYLANRDFRNSQIYREGYTKSQDVYKPNWERYTRQTNPYLIDFSKYMFEKGGGDLLNSNVKENEKKVGSIYDINPAAIDFFIRSYLGGPGSLTLDILSKIVKESSDKAKEYEKDYPNIIGHDYSSWPVVNAFVRTKSENYRFEDYKQASQWFEDMNNRWTALTKTNDIIRISKEKLDPRYSNFERIKAMFQGIDDAETGINGFKKLNETETNPIIIKQNEEAISALTKRIYGLRNDIITTYENRTRLPETKEAQPEGDSE